MRLLVVRHGIAEDRDEFAKTGQPDDLRPLTSEGRKKMRRNAKGLHHVVSKVDLIATSPLLRARETTEIIADEYKRAKIVETPSLAPEREPAEFLAWLLEQVGSETIAAVGHEPHLGKLIGFATTRSAHSFVELKKGGVCQIEFESAPEAGEGKISWLLAPGQLRDF